MRPGRRAVAWSLCAALAATGASAEERCGTCPPKRLPQDPLCPVVGADDALTCGEAAEGKRSAVVRYDRAVDPLLTLAAAGLAQGLSGGQKKQPIRGCSWCDRDAGGRDALNGFDDWGRRSFKWDDTNRADEASDVALGLSAAGPILLTALRRDKARGWPAVGDAALVAEAGALSLALAQVTKVGFRRERPFVHYGETAGHTPESGDNWSYPSGHAAASFATVVSAGVIAHRRGSGQERWIWLVGLPAAGITSYLRVAADRHYLSDILFGAATGSMVGLVVPRLHFERSKGAAGGEVLLGPAPAGAGLQVAYRW